MQCGGGPASQDGATKKGGWIIPVLAHRARGMKWSLTESDRVLTSCSDPLGLSQVEDVPWLTKSRQLRLRHEAME